jgi:glycosyltransferase involved in cell wall biosynthesis
MLSYSVVICTLDRQSDLRRCIESWLSQQPLPQQVVVVHGREDGALAEWLQEIVAGTTVALTYLRTAPSLVHQRNAGIDCATGDVVIFADDDAVYLEGYAKAILEAYERDGDELTGGVQGTIQGLRTRLASSVISRVFLLPRMGGGTLQASGWPAFYHGNAQRAPVRVFRGAAMSYRRAVLEEFRFDDALARYWVGDDFEMAYRVSSKYRLWQVADARLHHHVSPVGRDAAQRYARMNVVNHLYLSRKLCGDGATARLLWAWSEIGMWVVAALSLVAGRGAGRLRGLYDGYRELWATTGRRDAGRSRAGEIVKRS